MKKTLKRGLSLITGAVLGTCLAIGVSTSASAWNDTNMLGNGEVITAYTSPFINYARANDCVGKFGTGVLTWRARASIGGIVAQSSINTLIDGPIGVEQRRTHGTWVESSTTFWHCKKVS